MVERFESLKAALLVVLRGNGDAKRGGKRPRKSLPVSLPHLRRHGVETVDLRWLLSKGLIEDVAHAVNTLRQTSAKRPVYRLSRKSAFILTQSGLAIARDIAGSGGVPVPEPPGDAVKPVWESDSHALYFANLVVKQFKQPAPTQELILSVFEEENWPLHIDDPLPPQDEVVPAQRLHAAVRNLNRHQRHDLIRFESDGRGEGICWPPRREGT